MQKIKIIVNPTAGNGNAEKILPQVKKTLSDMELNYDVSITERPLHAVELAIDAAEKGFDIIAAMGGDGTVNEVLNGLMQANQKGHKNSALAVIGAGRGNDFAFGTGIPSSPENDCQILKNGRHRTIDVGRVFVDGSNHGRYFGNGIGIGFDTVVGFEAAKMKHLSGFPAYLVAALKTLFFYFKPPHVRIKLDDKELDQPALMISVMNGQRMGGGFMMAPDGDPGDGFLNYCIVSYGHRLRLLALMLSFMKGTQEGKKEVKSGLAKRIEIKALKGSLPAHADGETLCEEGNTIIAEIIPSCLDVIVS